MAHWEALGKSDDWYTPEYIFAALGCRFDLDVAAPQSGGYVPCGARLWDDSLNAEWWGFIWMNPPFGGRNGIGPWLAKFIAHGNGIALTPDRTSAPWFQRWGPTASCIRFIPRVRFERPDGSIGKSPNCGTALWAAGPRAAEILRAAPIGFAMEAA